jgi:hypothetical protein
MAEYESYKDGNGVTWKIVNAGTSMSAFIADDQSPRYSPDAPDQGPATKPSLPDGASQADITERDRRAFSNLREEIDAYAVAHKDNVVAMVTASPGGGVPGWVWLGLLFGLAMLADGKKRRR